MRCKLQFVECELGEHDECLGHVAVAGMLLVDPVPDVRALERSALHGGEVDLSGEVAVHEDAEAIAGAELALALAGAAANGERVAVLDHVGLPVHSLGFPLREPVDVAPPYLSPRGKSAATIGRSTIRRPNNVLKDFSTAPPPRRPAAT